MATWIILGIVWLIVAAAFTIVMGIKDYNNGNELVDYMAFFFCYGILWPISLPLTAMGWLFKWIVEKIHDRFA